MNQIKLKTNTCLLLNTNSIKLYQPIASNAVHHHQLDGTNISFT